MSFRPIILFLFIVSASSVAAQRSVEASLDSTQLLIGSQAQLTLSVRAEEGAKIIFPKFGPHSTLVDGIEVVKTLEVDTVSAMGGTMALCCRYVLTSFDSAQYHFTAPPVVVGSDTLRASDTLLLHVVSVPVDTLHLDQFYGAKDVAGETYAFDWKLIVWAVLALLLFIVALWMARRWKQEKRRVVQTVVTLPPTEDQVALEAIARLRGAILSTSEIALVYDELVEVLRQYIASRFNVETSLKTSLLLLREVSDKCQPHVLSLLQTALAASDYVRFANQQDVGRRDEPFAAAASFVDETKAPPRLSDTEVREEQEPLGKYRRRKLLWLLGTIVVALSVLWLCVNVVTNLFVLF